MRSGNLHSVAKALKKGRRRDQGDLRLAGCGKIRRGCASGGRGLQGFHGRHAPLRPGQGHHRPFPFEASLSWGFAWSSQMLFAESEEFGISKGLDVLSGPGGEVRSRPKSSYMGWNQIKIKKDMNPLLKGVKDGDYLYFVHSYYVVPKDSSIVAAESNYGGSTSPAWFGRRTCLEPSFTRKKPNLGA